MNEPLERHYLDDAITTFRAYKKLAEKALDQLRMIQYGINAMDPSVEGQLAQHGADSPEDGSGNQQDKRMRGYA